MTSSGQTTGGGSNVGDASMQVLNASAQYNHQYAFATPKEQFDTHVITLLVPITDFTPVKLDGITVPSSDFTTIAASDYAYTVIEVSEGAHLLGSDNAFGLSISGISNDSSYLYSGGARFEQINLKGDDNAPVCTLGSATVFKQEVFASDMIGTSADSNGNNKYDPDEGVEAEFVYHSGLNRIVLKNETNVALDLSSFTQGDLEADFSVSVLDKTKPGSATLQIFDKHGNEDSCNIVLTGDEAPKAVAELNLQDHPLPENVTEIQVDLNEEVVFSADKSTDNDDVAGYSWDFADGSPAISGSSALHSYTKAGDYLVTLTVSDQHGLTGETTVLVRVRISGITDVSNPTCEAEQIGREIRGMASDKILDEDLNKDGIISSPEQDTNGNGLIDLNSGIKSLELLSDSRNLELQVDEFLEGELSVDFKLTMTDSLIPSSGTLVVTDVYGHQCSLSVAMDNNLAPTAVATMITDLDPEPKTVLLINPGTTVTFDSSDSMDEDGEILGRSWQFEHSDNVESSAASFDYVFNHEASYTMILTVVDNEGRQDTSKVRIKVEDLNQAPTATVVVDSIVDPQGNSVLGDEHIPKGSVMTLTGLASDPDGVIVTYSWLLRDKAKNIHRKYQISTTADTDGLYILQEFDENGQLLGKDRLVASFSTIAVPIKNDGLFEVVLLVTDDKGKTSKIDSNSSSGRVSSTISHIESAGSLAWFSILILGFLAIRRR